jgi:hypothetical protein
MQATTTAAVPTRKSTMLMLNLCCALSMAQLMGQSPLCKQKG